MAEDAPRRQPTLDEVAERAGVSRSVASRALNNAPHVSRAKREAVERAVRQLGYVPESDRPRAGHASDGSGRPGRLRRGPVDLRRSLLRPGDRGGVGRPGGGRPASDAVPGRLRPGPQARRGTPSLQGGGRCDADGAARGRSAGPHGGRGADARRVRRTPGRSGSPVVRGRRQRRRSARGDRAPGLARPEARGRDLRASGHRGRTRPVPRLPGRHAGRRSRSAPSAGGGLHRAQRSRRHGRTAGRPSRRGRGVRRQRQHGGGSAAHVAGEAGRSPPMSPWSVSTT
ncbi:hypothetical protein SGLAM104S_08554 [Streptomyces glaucescens]